MPELPDLQIFAKNLRKRILDKPVASAEVFNKLKINVLADAFIETLSGSSVVEIARDGKELQFKLSNGSSFNVHLMLNGRFNICAAEELHKINSKIIALRFEDGQVLTVSDYQGLCKVTLNAKPSNVPDALSNEFTFEYFCRLINKNAKKNIKAFLIDQKIVRGIGNAYADEILWKADISPESDCGKIPVEYLRALYDAVSFVLNDAIGNIERIAPDIISGEERSFLRVHNSKKKFTDDGDKIIVKEIVSKKTYFTEKQKLFKNGIQF